MAARFSITGGDRLTAILKAGGPAAVKKVAAVVRRDGQALVAAARSAAPEKTGLLRRKITARYSQKGLIARVGVFNLVRTTSRKNRRRFYFVKAGLRRRLGMTGGRAGRVASGLLGIPFYARFQEYGTRFMKAHEFLHNTYGARRKQIAVDVAEAAIRALKRQGGAG